MPSRDDIDIVIISCEEDKDMFKKANIQTAYTAELLLTGILRQNLDLEQYVISCQNIMYSILVFTVVYMTPNTQDRGLGAFAALK